MAVTVFLSLYTTKVVLSALGVTDFGIFNVVGGVISMLTFLNNAMSTATQRFMSFAEGAGDNLRQKKIFNVSILLHVIIALIIFILLQIAGYFLFDGVLNIPVSRLESAKMVYQFMIISTIFTVISVPYDAVINAHENMLLYSLVGVLESVLRLLIALYITNTFFDKLYIYGLLMALLSIFLMLLRTAYCRRKYTECKINLRSYFDKPIFKELTSFASWSFLSATTSMFTFYGQGILINMFFGPAVNTAQAIATQISGQLGTFAGTMQRALNPVIAKSEGAGDRSFMLKASITGSKISFFLLMIFCIPVLLETEYVFQVWLKKVPRYSVIFCQFLLIQNLISQLFITLTVSISAVGNIRRFQMNMSIVHLLPLFFAYFFFLNGFPPHTIYVIFVTFSIIGAVVTLYFAKILCSLSVTDYLTDVVSRCLSVFIIVISISSIPLFFLSPGILRIIYIIGLNLIVFLISVWFIGFTKNERESLYAILNKIFVKVRTSYRLKVNSILK